MRVDNLGGVGVPLQPGKTPRVTKTLRPSWSVTLESRVARVDKLVGGLRGLVCS